ncbi:MAG: hypothetical protein KJO77_09815 [Bacteroidia bacterium]|nr:hypothetical protein [Bacteroidia bacterium]
MINFFRNIRRSLLTDSRTKKYFKYAIGEILLIVIGILIALQLNNWNEIRKNRNSEQLLLSSLLIEMEENYEQLNKVMGYNSKSRSAAKRMIEIYNGNYIYKNHQELDSVLALLQWAWTYNPQMGTLNSIKNSGQFNSIQDEKLRSLISSFEDLSSDALEENNVLRNLIINEYVPLVSQYVSLNQRLEFLGENYALGKSKFEPDYEGLFKDRKLESLISYIHTWRIDEFDEGEQFKRKIEEFISTLNKEIKL